MDSLKDLYIDQLKDAYSAEKQLVKALPKMIRAAENEQLTSALEEHLAITEEQVSRLDEIFSMLDSTARGKKCKGMEGLIEEGSELLEEEAEPEVLDAGIIVAAQKVEHYEIAMYGALRTFANMLGEAEAARLLELSLNEEKDADSKLNEIAMQLVNPEAENAGDGEGAEMDEEESESETESARPARRASSSRSSGRKSSTRKAASGRHR
jgi:ferritin-like metal-binding protein YciE